MRLSGFGECLPDPNNYVELDPEVVDHWGIPALRIHMTYGENERALQKDMVETAAEMLEASGAKEIDTFIEYDPPGLAIHEMGTARMGRDSKTSVLNEYCQTHDVKNLFVTDGSFMTSSSCVNPSITYVAMTARACDHIVKQMDLGAI
jgi:choline dehydrogenase-like flavoprotein